MKRSTFNTVFAWIWIVLLIVAVMYQKKQVEQLEDRLATIEATLGPTASLLEFLVDAQKDTDLSIPPHMACCSDGVRPWQNCYPVSQGVK